MKRKMNFKKLANILLLAATVLILVYLIAFVMIQGRPFNSFMPVYIVWLVALLLKMRMDQKERLARRKEFLSSR